MNLIFSKIDKQINICVLSENTENDEVFEAVSFLLSKYLKKDNEFTIKVEINGLIFKDLSCFNLKKFH